MARLRRDGGERGNRVARVSPETLALLEGLKALCKEKFDLEVSSPVLMQAALRYLGLYVGGRNFKDGEGLRKMLDTAYAENFHDPWF